MTVTRRRFLTISAAMAAAPAWAETHRWQGRAFGADVTLTIHGHRNEATRAIDDTRHILAEIETLFSLYDPASALSRLNTTGTLHDPDVRFLSLMRAADLGYRLTGGLFDPTVQPLWHALTEGRNPRAAAAAVGWDRVRFGQKVISLDKGQALTFNGIAQGFATDLITEGLSMRGLIKMLVDMGEYRAVSGPWRLAIDDPVHGILGTHTITNTAIATSSPTAMYLGNQSHIMHPKGQPLWSTVSVEATTATLADSLSTALCLASRDQIAAVRQAKDVQRITVIDFDGDLTTY